MIDATGKPIVVIGTRGSALALWQSEYVMRRLQALHSDHSFVLKRITTGGDLDQKSALAEIGTRGVFVKEIQSALLSGEIDLGIHSLKDLPSELDPRLVLAAFGPREDPRDALVSREMVPLSELPPGARVATGSPRRAVQLKLARPDLVIEDIRGNVDTRVRKVLRGDFDAVVLAAAGLRRLGLESHIAEYLPLSTMLPAPGQGIIAVEARAEEIAVLRIAAAVDDPDAHLAARAERAFVRALGGGCTIPLAAHATAEGGTLRIEGLLASPDGAILVRDRVDGDIAFPEFAGEQLADRIVASSGPELLDQLH